MDLSHHRQAVAHSLTALESCVKRLVDTLAHRDAWFSVDGARSDRGARAQVCAAYSTIDYAMEDEVGSSVVCLGVVGGNADLVKRAEAVNAAKAAFKAVCAPLKNIRTRVPVKENGGGTKAIPVIRVVLRGIQRSDVNLLAAYRKIPILDAPPLSVTYTRARTRAVYRNSIEEVYNLLINMEGPLASADRARLATLAKDDKYLAVIRPHYDNVRRVRTPGLTRAGPRADGGGIAADLLHREALHDPGGHVSAGNGGRSGTAAKKEAVGVGREAVFADGCGVSVPPGVNLPDRLGRAFNVKSAVFESGFVTVRFKLIWAYI